MPTQNLPSQQRISKATGRKMIALAVFFDLLPGFFLTVLFVLAAGFLMGDVGEDVMDSFGGNFIDDKWNQFQIWAKVGGSAAAALAAFIVAGPFIYTFISFLATFTAFLLFTIWFLLKKVNIWTFSSGQRVLTNVFATIVEFIPVLNLFPGITVMVWRHIKVSRAEDTVKDKELASKASRRITQASQT